MTDRNRRCGECGRDVPADEALFMCDEPDAKDQYCGQCFEAWGCEDGHPEGCATYVFGD